VVLFGSIKFVVAVFYVERKPGSPLEVMWRKCFNSRRVRGGGLGFAEKKPGRGLKGNGLGKGQRVRQGEKKPALLTEKKCDLTGDAFEIKQDDNYTIVFQLREEKMGREGEKKKTILRQGMEAGANQCN